MPLRLVLCAFASVVGLLLLNPAASTQASDVALGSVRLRGGFDANPRLLPGGTGSGFAGVDGAFAIGREDGATKSGLVGEMERTEYTAGSIAPSERYRLGVEAETTAIGNWSLRSSSSIENTRTATLRSFDAAQRVRAGWTEGPVRSFVTAEIRYASLNETNAILTDFLPEDQRFGRATVTPGVTVALGGGAEVGASVSLSGTRYTEQLDLFGFRRDNERAEPFLFARYEGQGLSMSASVSRLHGRWHDVDFSDVRETLYDASLSKTIGAWTLDLGAKRFAGDTTFPISPLTISTGQFAKLSFAPDDRWKFGVLGRTLRTAYLDSPWSTAVLAYGVTASYALAKDWLVAAELLRINSTALNGEAADGGVVSLSLTRRFARDASPERTNPFQQKQWATDRPPPIAQPNPVPGPPSLRVPYQP